MAKTEWFTSKKYPGVRWYEHPTRKHGLRRDRCFGIRYQIGNNRHEAILGWESADISEKKAMLERERLIEAHRRGDGPVTLKEKRRKAEKKRKLEADSSTTLSEYWDRAYFPHAQRVKKESSWSKEESHFRLWLKPVLGDISLKEIEVTHWDELVKVLSARGLSQRSKEYITGTMRRILKHAYERRKIKNAPPSGKRVGVTAPRDNRRLRVITPTERNAILDHLKATDLNAYWITLFAFLTGCRAGEAFKLKWSNVDLESGTLTFTRTKNQDPRTLHLSAPLQALFNGLKPGLPDEFVFPNRNELPYAQAPNAFRTAIVSLGLNEGRSKRDRISFHSIRHTVATELAKTLNLRDLMEVMGWRTVQMAMRYVHGNEDAKKKALERLGTPQAKGKVIPLTA